SGSHAGDGMATITSPLSPPTPRPIRSSMLLYRATAASWHRSPRNPGTSVSFWNLQPHHAHEPQTLIIFAVRRVDLGDEHPRGIRLAGPARPRENEARLWKAPGQ